jgi:hypothetical protein
MTRRILTLLTLATSALQGCSGAGESTDVGPVNLDSAAADVEGGEVNIAETSQDLYFNPSWLWGKSTLSVCWGNSASNNPIEKHWVRLAVENSIERLVGVDFVGWGTCDGSGADIHIEVADFYNPAAEIGTSEGWATEDMHLNFFEGLLPPGLSSTIEHCFSEHPRGSQPYTSATGKSWPTTRQYCIETIAVHEFLHALGLEHEQYSPLHNNSSCKVDEEDKIPDPQFTTYGYWDFVSATNYCNPLYRGETFLSPLDVSGLGLFFGLPYNDQLWYGIGNIRDYTDGRYRGDGFLFDMNNYAISGNYSPKVGDFNGDGRSDILWYLPGTGQDMVYFGNSWGNGFDVSYVTQDLSMQVAIADFNNDGRDDILWHVPSTGQNTIWYGQANKTFTSANAPYTPGGYGHKPYAGDFDGDGYGDIFWDSQGALSDQIWYGTSSGFDQRLVSLPDGTQPVVGDFDGDGKSDIYFYKPGPDADRMDYGTSTRGYFVSEPLNLNDTATPTVADFDGNGTSDILWSYPGVTDKIWLFSTFRGTPKSVPTSSLLASYLGDAIPLGGDYNGDGIGDVFWFSR